MGKIYENDIGTTIMVETKVDLTNYSSLALMVVKPSGTEVQWIPSSPTPSSGVLVYVTVSGDLDEIGVYRVYAVVTYADGSSFTGEVDTFTVHEVGT